MVLSVFDWASRRPRQFRPPAAAAALPIDSSFPGHFTGFTHSANDPDDPSPSLTSTPSLPPSLPPTKQAISMPPPLPSPNQFAR